MDVAGVTPAIHAYSEGNRLRPDEAHSHEARCVVGYGHVCLYLRICTHVHSLLQRGQPAAARRPAQPRSRVRHHYGQANDQLHCSIGSLCRMWHIVVCMCALSLQRGQQAETRRAAQPRSQVGPCPVLIHTSCLAELYPVLCIVRRGAVCMGRARQPQQPPKPHNLGTLPHTSSQRRRLQYHQLHGREATWVAGKPCVHLVYRYVGKSKAHDPTTLSAEDEGCGPTSRTTVVPRGLMLQAP